jgi:hypothetical protein
MAKGKKMEGKFAIAERKKMKSGFFFLFTGFVPTGWAPCCETWQKFESEAKSTVGNKKNGCLWRKN